MRICHPVYIAVVLAMVSGWQTPAQAQNADIVPVKLGLDYLSAPQTTELWDKTEFFAMAEALATSCGKPIGVEKLAAEAVRACITDAALEKVRARYRGLLTTHTAKFRGIDCSKSDVKTS